MSKGWRTVSIILTRRDYALIRDVQHTERVDSLNALIRPVVLSHFRRRHKRLHPEQYDNGGGK